MGISFCYYFSDPLVFLGLMLTVVLASFAEAHRIKLLTDG